MRSKTCAGLVCLVALLATPVASQSRTEDGIRAMLRGDYQQAAQILQPLANGTERPDPIARFFLALLYNTGNGVRRDEGRACTLFLQAAAHPHPFAEQSAAIGTLMRSLLGGEASPLCVADQGPYRRPSKPFGLDAGLAALRDGPPAVVDGVVALVRGDYGTAVEILKPIAEDWRGSDTAAQFFMAGLYEAGRGVPVDPVRACALNLRASVDYDHPFGRAASSLFMASTARGLEFDERCQLLAKVGFDHGFEPATLYLGPGHSVEFTLSAATVTYGGRSKRQEVVYAPWGARFLPLQYIELPAGPTHSQTRHFVEVFHWEPAGKSGPWHLRWQLFEIVRDEVVRIETPAPLATIEGETPPSREAFNVRDYAVLRVDADGNAEWAALKGADARSERIESDAERQKVREEARGRDEALKAVDWSRRSDVNRDPVGTYVGAEGCGHMRMYGWTTSRDEAIIIRIAGRDLGLSTQPAIFDLSREMSNIAVETQVYEAPQRQFYFCSDVIIRKVGSTGPETWRAVAGTITIELSPPGVRARAPHQRRATVTLNGLTLRNSAGKTVTVPHPVKLTAIVGSMMGG